MFSEMDGFFHKTFTKVRQWKGFSVRPAVVKRNLFVHGYVCSGSTLLFHLPTWKAGTGHLPVLLCPCMIWPPHVVAIMRWSSDLWVPNALLAHTYEIKVKNLNIRLKLRSVLLSCFTLCLFTVFVCSLFCILIPSCHLYTILYSSITFHLSHQSTNKTFFT